MVDLTIEQQEKDIKRPQSPSLTIGIPALNEEAHIERVIRGFLGTGYQNLVEILIADGGSTDKTREIVAQLSKEDSRVKLVENPEKFQSFGLNKMIDVAKGEVFIRADAHCNYKENYVEKCIEILLRTGAKNVGGPTRHVAKTVVQAGISLAVKSYLGNGGAKHMDSQYEGYGDTVFAGCFWTKDLREVGGFSIVNITNQDSELNLRLIDVFGGESIYISPDIQSWYFPREKLSKLFKQYFRYGRGRFITKSFHPRQSPIRGILPFLFVLTLSIFIISDLVIKTDLSSVWVISILLVILFAESIRTVISNEQSFNDEIWSTSKKPPNLGTRVLATVACVVIMQLAHFSGFLYQLFRRIGLFKKGW